MDNALIWIIILGVLLLSTLIGLLVSLFNGDMKKFVVEKMAEAEKMFPKGTEDYQNKRRTYVIEAYKEKYKILQFILNVKAFIELVCKYCKFKNIKK